MLVKLTPAGERIFNVFWGMWTARAVLKMLHIADKISKFKTWYFDVKFGRERHKREIDAKKELLKEEKKSRGNKHK